MASNGDLTSLKQAMYWSEKNIQIFHIDAFNFGRSVIPLLKLKFDEAKDDLVDFLKSYGSYRTRRPSVYAYTIRHTFIQYLVDETPSVLGIFTNTQAVQKLVKKQASVHRMAVLVNAGWQDAMKHAGIWDDDTAWKNI